MSEATGPITRSFPVDDLVVRAEGDGRTVEAYAAVFNTPAEIKDQYGHYHEVIDRTAFDGVLKRGVKPKVMFNHGRDIFGNPSDRWNAPVAVHESAVADGMGLRVVQRYVETPAGDEALELVRSGAVDGFSFSGKPNRSKKMEASKAGDLPTIVRQELSLVEYGPAVFGAYTDAKVLAIRSKIEGDEFDPTEVVELLATLTQHQLVDLVPVLRSRVPDLADELGRSGDPVNADDSASQAAQPVAGESTDQARRRQMAARIRKFT